MRGIVSNLILVFLHSTCSIWVVSAAGQSAHRGSAEAAVVGVEVLATSKDGAAQQIRRGNGVIIRCDGFILAPSWLFSKTVNIGGQAEPAGEQRITVVTDPGTAKEKRVAGRNPRFTSREVGYSVLKLLEFHRPGAGLALPDAFKDGGAPALLFSRYDFPQRRFLPMERRSAALGKSADDASKESLGIVPFQRVEPGVPSGAVVVDEADRVIGMNVGNDPVGAVDFTSLDVLHLATNCVTPVPPGKDEDRDMLPVAGGSVTLPPAVIAQQPDMEGSLAGCMPPFQIDRFEVTNEEYLAYWATLPEANRRSLGFRSNYYPWTWAPWPSTQPFPVAIARHPVLGVPVSGARGFARWKGKRLPTPYEWYLAAMGPRGQVQPPDWIGRYLSEKRTLWERLALLHTQQLQSRRDLQQDGIFIQGPVRLPWLASTSFHLEAATWSRKSITSAFGPFWASWREPLYVRPVGSREFDTGHSGMMDALLNASEMAAPYPGPPGLGNPRYFEIQWLPPVPPTPQEPWMPASISAMTDDRPFQPLSRLYRRLTQGPSIEDLILWSNINEAVQIMTPNSGWSLSYTGDFKVTATMMPPDRSPYAKVARPAGFQLWQEMPPYTKREMGRDTPLQGPGERGGPGPQLHYFLPVGFRCAR